MKDTSDPFAAQRETGQPIENGGDTTASEPTKLATSPKEDRRLSSDEWGPSPPFLFPLSSPLIPFPFLLPSPQTLQRKTKAETIERGINC